MDATRAIRAVVRGRVQGVGFRDATVHRARALGLLGWVRNGPDGDVLVHAEGPEEALAALEAFLRERPPPARVEQVDVERTKVEGHEQFAIRGVSAGAFVVREHAASTRHFDLRLEVAGTMRSWALPKGPSLDPAVKRLAVEVPDHDLDPRLSEGALGSRGLRAGRPRAMARGAGARPRCLRAARRKAVRRLRTAAHRSVWWHRHGVMAIACASRRFAFMLFAWHHVHNMASMIQIRNVPEALHRDLKVRAARSGMTLSDFLLSELRGLAVRPTMHEWLDRSTRWEPVEVSESPAEALAAERGRHAG
jgi:acylphosphatase